VPEKPKEFKVEFPKEMRGGVYANNMVVAHTKEEFIMDFILLAPPAGTVAARVIVSPGHMKRVLKALEENVSKYEAKFGAIQASDGPMGEVTLQ